MARLGNTGIEVSKLCFGSLTLSSFQANLSVREGAKLIQYAYDKGIDFIDTAEIYENYSIIKEGIKNIPKDKYTIASKAYSYDVKTAQDSVAKAMKELSVDYLDIFLLHEQESEHTLRGHYEALEELFRLKEKGYIRSVGISTHFVNCVKASEKYKEIEIIHPILNYKGIGIQDGTREDMVSALKRRHEQGIGIYTMKALGGGHLISHQKEAMEWVLEQDFLHSTAIGMQSTEEIDYNTHLFFQGKENLSAKESIDKKERKLIVDDYCIGCGNCVRRCKQNGIEIIDGQATPNENCILCGYCATVCPDFCIKVV
ncbi:aldo/keto reductase [Peptoniphilus sp. KCTC 25270]|uniref:aldo/keto reductase n=1 Tax=Peptoniphilus sp. KCTC 25270 TaxID=2897414 RepID=UPI001E43C111|nr:aldo/keto reductase [Peptoniphilus sp. KCTC 25270]MCD1147175.1 aldo/keto reductase [Peptoniphilus sp. KCTC 25270]